MPLTGRLPLAQRLASSVERIVFDAERQHMLTVVAIFELVMALGIAEVWTADILAVRWISAAGPSTRARRDQRVRGDARSVVKPREGVVRQDSTLGGFPS